MDMPQALDPEVQGQQAIAVAVTISTQVSDKRSIVMQTYLPRDAGLQQYHDTLDKLGRAVDRQEAKYGLIALKTSLAQHEKTQAQLKDDYSKVGEKNAAEWKARGKQGDPKLNPSEVAAKGNAEQTIKRYVVEIAKIKAEIEQCEAEINKVD